MADNQAVGPPARISRMPKLPELAKNNVHVWAFRLELQPAALAWLTCSLCAEECERAARFRFDHHRNRFIVGRSVLRRILGHYLDCDPAVIEFAYGPHGKPVIAGPLNGSELHFNLAHSEGIALVGITRAGLIGVDIEQIRSLKDADELVARFFSPRENEAYQRLPAEQKPTAFFNLWTRKEAWLKATGDGIAQYLNRVEVSFLPETPARLLSLPGDFQPEITWSLHELAPSAGFAAAMSVAAENPLVTCWQYGSSNFNEPHHHGFC